MIHHHSVLTSACTLCWCACLHVFVFACLPFTALRAEVATYEGQLEAERKAHAATKAAAASRERDLEEQLGSSRCVWVCALCVCLCVCVSVGDASRTCKLLSRPYLTTECVSCCGVLCCSEALAATQRQLEEASCKARELEEQQLLAAAEAARLQQQVWLWFQTV